AVEMATLKWVHWYNHQRLLSSIAIFPLRRLGQTSPNNKQVRPWRPDLNETASPKPRATPFSDPAGRVLRGSKGHLGPGRVVSAKAGYGSLIVRDTGLRSTHHAD